MGGLLSIDASLRRPVRLVEIGSSGGLNLRADRFAYVDASGTAFGDPRTRRSSWTTPGRAGPCPRGRTCGSSSGSAATCCPSTSSTTEGRLALTAYVWPDQHARLERLRGALDLAQRAGSRCAARTPSRSSSRSPCAEGATTVLWHSVMWQYLTAAEQDAVSARVAALGAAASPDAPFAHLFLEPTRRAPDGEHEFLVGARDVAHGRPPGPGHVGRARAAHDVGAGQAAGVTFVNR